MIDKICPIIGKRCIGEECEGYDITSTGSCEIWETDRDFTKCPANHHEIKLFGRKLFTYIGSSHYLHPGIQKHCNGCKYRGKHFFNYCEYANDKMLSDGFVKDGDNIE